MGARVLGNRTFDEWEKAGRPAAPHRPGEGEVIATAPDGADFHRYDDMPPLAHLEGKLDHMALYAGQSVGLVTDVQPPARFWPRSWANAAQALRRWSPE
jgi:hypothetical protein